jgi:hypothetical protein
LTKKLFLTMAVLLAVAMAAMAADAVSGKWTMERPGRDGGPAMVTTFDLKAEGAKLTGTMAMGGFGGMEAPPPMPISNGKVTGANIAFDVVMDFGGNGGMTMKYEGVVAGDEIKMKTTMPGRDGGEPRTMEATAKRAK